MDTKKNKRLLRAIPANFFFFLGIDLLLSSVYKILSSLTTRDAAPVRRKERGEEREKREREILKSPTRSCGGRGKLRSLSGWWLEEYVGIYSVM